ncbi:hypothetical protein ERX46_03875 [Brumimicrobium glaciale]|uniref:Glycosyltransferase n=1 Tax=Brumimicrobium glaciale TaxID=200475 RepID=A0A4Q4KMB0_9FLAO|nr:hypothetical protein [Brumimicrobium glaciale]RYM34521.1 hypothetical protein ERX46_03875 [Brumimicrobium glaciale]
MIDFFSRIYSSIENKNPFLSKIKFYGAQRTIIKLLANFFVPVYLRTSKSKSYKLVNNQKSDLIVSLTTFPARINKIWIVIECMLRQTHTPDRIILWLSKEQFKDLNLLPKRLLKLRERGLEIELCDGDLRSHKKYVYTLRNFPDSHFITVDDDFLYPSSLIEELMIEHQKNPSFILCHRAHMMTSNNEKLDSYNKWTKEYKGSSTSKNVLFTSGGGTFFPAHSLGKEAANENVFMDICRLADDVWLNAMSKLQGTTIYKIESKYNVNIPIMITSNISLSAENVDDNQNDVQINAVRTHYYKTVNKGIFTGVVD